MNIIKKRNAYLEEYQALNIPFKIKIKSFLTGLFFSTIIVLLPLVFLFNLLIFYEYLYFIITSIFFFIILWIYLTTSFMNKALIVYDERVANCNLKYVNRVDIVFYGLIVIVCAIVCFKFLFRI